MRPRLATLAVASLLLAVTVLRAGWEGTVDVGGTFGPPVEGSVRVARNVAGIGAAVWLETVGGRTRPVASRHDGVVWSPATVLDGADRDADCIDVAVSSDGDVHVVWRAHDSPATIQAVRHAAEGSGWSAPAPVDDPDDPADVRSADIAASNGGVAMALWAEGDSLFVRPFAPATGWGEREALSSRSLSKEDPVGSIAMDASGHGVVAWSSFDGQNYRVKAIYWDGAWSAVQAIDTDPTFESRTPVVAMDGTGRAAAAWLHNAGAWEPRVAWFDGFAWEDAVNPAPPPGVFLPEVSEPRVAAAPGGGGLAAFEASPGPRVWATVRRDGAWSDLVGFPDEGSSLQPTVALDPAGGGFVAFHSRGVVRAARWDGTAFGSPEHVGADIGGSGRFPRVGTGPEGEGYVFYHREDGVNRWVTISSFAGGTPPPPPSPPEVRKVRVRSASPGSKLTLRGKGFGEEEGRVRFGPLDATVLKWKKGRIDVVVPEGTGSPDVVVELADGRTVAVPFAYALPALVKLTPKRPKPPGGKVRLRGSDLGTVDHGEASRVLFGGTEIGAGDPRLISWSAKAVKVVVPPGVGTVAVQVVTSVGESEVLLYAYP